MKNICLQMNRKVLLSAILSLFVALPVLAQKITVQGTVVDTAGEPLIGASVIPAGTTTGTATDFDGSFTISVDPNATLTVSYVGYEPQSVAVAGRTNITIELKESGVLLNEVVAIGYGTVKKDDATGSVATVKPNDIEAGLATSVQDMLVGQTPGVVVTTEAGPEGRGTIRIRGGSSLNAKNDPLIVVDGVPLDNGGVQGMGNALSMIAPDNVESMTILKDASATAIYGSRASNGVIIVTTKKGKAGRPQVNFSANMYVNTARNTWGVLHAGEFAELIRNYHGEDSQAAKALGTDMNNWQSKVLSTTVSSDYNLSVGGTLGWLPYRISATYTDNNGILDTSTMDRTTVSINLTPKFFDNHLSVNANVKGYYIRNRFADTGAVGAAIAFDPTKPVYTNYALASGSSISGSLFNGYTTWMSGSVINENSTVNPVSLLQEIDNVANVYRSNGNLQLDYAVHFLPDLHLNLNLGYDVSKTDEHYKVAANSPSAWRQWNKNANGAATDNYIYQFKSNTLLDFYVNYKKEVEAIRSNFDVTAGYSWQRFSANGWNYGDNNDRGVYASRQFNLPVATDNGYLLTYKDGSESAIGTPYKKDQMDPEGNYHWRNHLQLISFFGRLNYSLLNRYLLTFTMRGDATSRFSPDNRWGAFPSVALGWKISEEAFMESARSWMNEWKLRLGWGITGQQDIGSTCNYLPLYQYSQAGSYYPVVDTNGNIVYAQTLYLLGYNPDLKWEETTTWNAGFDFGFLNNRITASLDYYFRKTKDLLSYVPIAVGSSTVNMLNKNIGSLENQGIEFSINARPVVTKDFTWTVNYNIAWNRNRITELNDNAAVINVGGISGGTGNTVQAHKVGYPAFSYLLYEQVYDENGLPIEGEFVDQDGNGEINEGDKVIRHSKDPKITMTFGTTFNWKNWDFGFNLRANIGNYVYNDALSTHTTLSDTYKNTNLTNLIRNNFYFQGGGSHNNYMSDYWLRNASFVRCDNITLGYTWNNLLNDQLRLRLYGAVQNPFVFTKYNGLDPEVESGIDNSVYPRPITVSFGLVATF